MTTRHTTRRTVLAQGANTTRRHMLALGAAALATPFISRLSFAQAAWPTRTIRCIIPFSAGSSVDIVGRLVLEPLSQALGQPIVIENRGGAGGSIGSGMVAQADPDGYTILVNAAAHSAAPAAFPNITYDPAGEFAGVVMFGTVPNVVIISPEKGIKTLDELVAKAKKESMTFGSAGGKSVV